MIVISGIGDLMCCCRLTICSDSLGHWLSFNSTLWYILMPRSALRPLLPVCPSFCWLVTFFSCSVVSMHAWLVINGFYRRENRKLRRACCSVFGAGNDDGDGLIVVVRDTRNSFWTKMNEITKFSILDEKQNSQFWTKFGQKVANWSSKKLSTSFTFISITIMLL